MPGKRGNNPQNVSIVTWPSPKICIFYNDIYDLGVLYNFENPTESLAMVYIEN